SPILRYYIVLATIGETPEGVEVGQFLVRNGPGVRIEPTWDVMAMRSTASDDIVLEDALVPESDVVSRRRLGAPGPGAPGGAYFSLGVGGVYLAIGEAARDAAIEFARARADRLGAADRNDPEHPAPRGPHGPAADGGAGAALRRRAGLVGLPHGARNA